MPMGDSPGPRPDAMPTCWYCPECSFVDNFCWKGPHYVPDQSRKCAGAMIKCVVIPQGTPLTVIRGTRTMTSLPTCWYCPECDQVGGGHKLECYSKTPPSPIKVPMILPGTPLTVILDTLGIEYHVEGRHSEDTRRGGCAPWPRNRRGV